MEFNYLMPTKIYFGPDCVVKNAAEFARWGKRALIVTGRRSAQASGALDDVRRALADQGMEWEIFDRVEENPALSIVEAGGQLARQFKPDLVIGIGGGSPLDAAKAVAVLAVNDIEGRKLFDGIFPVRPLPVIALPTTAGTGSEVTPTSVLTDAERRTKRSFSHPDSFPKAAFLDARYTVSQPWPVTVNTAVDALSHSIEGYLANKANVLSDYLALEGIRRFGRTMPSLAKGSLTMEEREQLMYAAMLGGMVIAQTGTTLVHALGYPLTYFHNIPHGRANGLLLGEYLRLMEQAVPQKVAAVLSATGVQTVDEFKTMLRGFLGSPEELTADEAEEFCRIAIGARNIANTPGKPGLEDLKRVLKASVKVK